MQYTSENQDKILSSIENEYTACLNDEPAGITCNRKPFLRSAAESRENRLGKPIFVELADFPYNHESLMVLYEIFLNQNDDVTYKNFTLNLGQDISWYDRKFLRRQLGEINSFVEEIKVYSEALREPTEPFATQTGLVIEDDFEDVRSCLEAFANWFRNFLNVILLVIVLLLRQNDESYFRIRRGVEGYIPFITWARGSIVSQPANPPNFVGRLSQKENMELSHGC